MSRILPFNDLYRPVDKYVNVEFGNPRKRDCRGVGICNVELAGSLPSLNACRCKSCSSPAFLSYTPRNNKIQLHFRRKAISYQVYHQQFRNGLFRLEEDYIFAKDFVRKCGLPTDARIKRGLYPIQEKGDHLRIYFPIGTATNLPFLAITDHRFPQTV